MSTTSMEQLVQQILFEYAEPMVVLQAEDLELVETILRKYS